VEHFDSAFGTALAMPQCPGVSGMREKQRKKKRKNRTKDEQKDARSNKQRGNKNPQNKENEPTWQFWLGFEE
jgi:hypothetical protein